MKEDFSAINRTLNVGSDYIIEVSYDNCIPYPNVGEKEKTINDANKIYETMRKIITYCNFEDYVKKPELRVIEHTPRSRYNWGQKHKKKDTTKDRPVRIINREDLGYMKPGLIDKVNQTKFIF
jgi:hypothetical protein